MSSPFLNFVVPFLGLRRKCIKTVYSGEKMHKYTVSQTPSVAVRESVRNARLGKPKSLGVSEASWRKEEQKHKYAENLNFYSERPAVLCLPLRGSCWLTFISRATGLRAAARTLSVSDSCSAQVAIPLGLPYFPHLFSGSVAFYADTSRFAGLQPLGSRLALESYLSPSDIYIVSQIFRFVNTFF